ncbi:LytR C-terminal domain-containing protein [Desulfonatronum thiosulfatophilum]|uniref:LytR C-terminal domain-containing protein n=1 Tax=Desulfonatronum thiosulfatophilum TaxID=617002 RepID=UPI00137B74EB|nr:LytR C-terminal domain-containing protein [Desulfonatronum thiosulfatophilum]
MWDRNHDSQPWGTQHRTTMTDQELRRLVASARPFIRNPQMHFRQGLYFQARGQHKLAVDEFAKVLLLEPDHIKALNAMAVSCDKLENYEQAVGLYKQALSLDPDQDYIYNNLGYSYFLQGNYTAAVEAFHKAVTLDESNKIFLNNLGMAYAQKGLFEEALAKFQGDAHADGVMPGPIKPTEQILNVPKAAVPPPASEPVGSIDHAEHPAPHADPNPLIEIQIEEQTETAQSDPESRHWIRKPLPEQPGKTPDDPELLEPRGLEEPTKTFEPERPLEFERPPHPEQFKKPHEIVVVADSRSPNPAPPAEQPLSESGGTPSNSDHHTEQQTVPQTNSPLDHQPEHPTEQQSDPAPLPLHPRAIPAPVPPTEQPGTPEAIFKKPSPILPTPAPKPAPVTEQKPAPATVVTAMAETLLALEVPAAKNDSTLEIESQLKPQAEPEVQSATRHASASVPFAPHRPTNQHDFLKAVPVEVLNGNGISRMAHQVGSYLEENGFRVIRKKNADHFDHPRTIIHYGIGYLPAAELLSRQFPGEYLLKEEALLGNSASRIRVVVGKDLDQHQMAVLKRRQDEDATHHAASGQGTLISRGPDSPVRP